MHTYRGRLASLIDPCTLLVRLDLGFELPWFMTKLHLYGLAPVPGAVAGRYTGEDYVRSMLGSSFQTYAVLKSGASYYADVYLDDGRNFNQMLLGIGYAKPLEEIAP